jgi:hypothetical protein
MPLGSRGVYEALKKLFVTDKDGHITIDNVSVAVTADWPATFPDTDTEPRNVKQWGGTALTGRNITSDLAKLDVALSTRATEQTQIDSASLLSLALQGKASLKCFVASQIYTTLADSGLGEIIISNPAGSGYDVLLVGIIAYTSGASTSHGLAVRARTLGKRTTGGSSITPADIAQRGNTSVCSAYSGATDDGAFITVFVDGDSTVFGKTFFPANGFPVLCAPPGKDVQFMLQNLSGGAVSHYLRGFWVEKPV